MRLDHWIATLLASCGAGLLYSQLSGTGHPLFAGFNAICIGSAVLSSEAYLRKSRFSSGLRQQPSFVYLPIAYLTILLAVLAGNGAGGLLGWALGLVDGWVPLLSGQGLVYALVVSVLIAFATRVRDLVGAEAAVNLLLGRYQRPIVEERIFLFVDVVGSTSYAETYGDLAAQTWLSAVFSAIAEPVRRHHGTVEDYVGDLVIVSWPLARGVKHARCVACLFDIEAVLTGDPARWTNQFPRVPQIRAALHGGSVVTAEVGVDRHKIAYFGDVVNTTARLEALSRTLRERFVISGDLLNRLGPLDRVAQARDLGVHRLRGRDQLLAVHGLDRATQVGPERTREAQLT